MLCVCVVDVMDVVFSVCIVMRGAAGARVWLLFFSSISLCLSSVHIILNYINPLDIYLYFIYFTSM